MIVTALGIERILMTTLHAAAASFLFLVIVTEPAVAGARQEAKASWTKTQVWRSSRKSGGSRMP